MSPIEVQHQADGLRFVVDQAGQQAELTYTLRATPAGSTINFDHTYVPFRLRGKGIAEALVEQGLAWARAQGYSIQASCWYVEKHLTTSA